MRNLLLIVKHEIKTALSKPSFWILSFLFPLLLLGINMASGQAIDRTIAERNAAQALTGQAATQALGVVDEAGLLAEVPPSLPAGAVRYYRNFDSARLALQSNEISQVVQIGKDFPQTGRVVVTMRDFNPMEGTPSRLVQYLLAYNLTGDEELAGRIVAPLAQIEAQQVTATEAGAMGQQGIFVSMATLFIFFFLLLTSSSWMLQSVSREKVNRTAEVLLLSVNPQEIMLGKILGLSVVAFTQMLIWVGGGMFLLDSGAQLLEFGINLQLPPGFLLASVVFFALGYLMFASLMGAIGALAPDIRDAGNFLYLVTLPLATPMMLNSAFNHDPGGALAVFLSLFPLTAPTSMLTRLAIMQVPAWQVAVSLSLLLVTTVMFVRLSARTFRADTLLSNKALNWSVLKKELIPFR